MESLSIEILDLIIRKLDLKSLLHAAGVCHQWKSCGHNWRLWQALYFEQWPRFKNDLQYKKTVDKDWMQLYIRIQTYSKYIFRLHTIPMSDGIRLFMEETLISPYVTNKNCLITGTVSGHFYRIYHTIRAVEDKNELFTPFLHDMSCSFFKFEEDFLPVLTAAKAQKKKVLFLLNDFDDTPAGVNPLITSPKLRTHLIDLLTKNREDIILMIHSNGPEKINEPWIDFFVSWDVSLVHVTLPTKATRLAVLKHLVGELNEENEYGTVIKDIDCELIAEKTAGANEDVLKQLWTSAVNSVLRVVYEVRKNEEDLLHVVITTEDVLKELPKIHYYKDLTKPIESAYWDEDIVRTLKKIVDVNPSLKIVHV